MTKIYHVLFSIAKKCDYVTNAHDLCQIICRNDAIFRKLWNDIPTFQNISNRFVATAIYSKPSKLIGTSNNIRYM